MMVNLNGNNKKPLRAVIYARVSTKAQAADEVPLTGQIWECQDYVASQGWQVFEVIEDGGISGRTDERPGFQRLIALAKEKPRPFDVIVVWKANRFSRKLEHRITYQALLRRLGIKVVSVKEPELDGALGFLVESILAVVDEFLTLQIGEDVLRGQKEIARQGYSAGGRPPKGYRGAKKVVGLKKDGEPIFRTAWEPDPEWRDKALQAFQMAAEGRSFTEIVQTTGVVANKSSLSTYLHNRAFIGERVYNKQRHVETKAIRVTNPEEEWVVVPEAYEAIVPEELFNEVQQVLGKKRSSHFSDRSLRSDYLLSRLLWCHQHKCHYVGWANQTREYYACSLRNKNLIPASECRLLRKGAIEEFILKVVADEILQPSTVRQGLVAIEEEARREQEAANSKDGALEGEVKQVEEKLARYQNAITQGVDPRALADPMNRCYERLNALRTKLAEAEHQTRTDIEFTDELVGEVIRSARQYLEEGSLEETKLLLRDLIDRVEIMGEEVTIHYTFRKQIQK